MKKPYFCIKSIATMVFILLMQTSFAQEVETQQQTNTEQTNSIEGAVHSSTVTYGATGGTGQDGDIFFENPFLNDILSSTSPGSLFSTSKSFHVDKSTGKVNVKVPIATVGPEGLKIPIQLGYTTGGVKVRDVASWVGLGWDLSVGGKITRVLRRFPDKFDHSLDTLLDRYTWKSRFRVLNGEDNFDTRLENDDTQPDLFYFEIPGKSGMFAFDKDNKAHTIPYQNLIINYDIADETFEIIDEEGTRYYFNDMEHTRIHKSKDEDDEDDINYKSEWYLSSAHNIQGENVSFEYKPLGNQRKYFYKTKVKSLKARVLNFSPWITIKADSTEYETSVDPLYLTKISWNNGHVEFISTADREDIPNQQAFKLNNIKFYAGEDAGTLFKSYNFEYSTFPNNNKALKLDKINISSPRSIAHEFFRKFDYFPITGIGSNDLVSEYQIDHWGYYNGSGSRTGIPYAEVGSQRVGEDARTPVLVHTLANSLQRIWVTSSGYDEFEYELNTLRYMPNPNNPNVIKIEDVGGLRIKSITTKSTELSNAMTKVRYEYADDKCASSGVAFDVPNYTYLSSIENSHSCYTVTDSPIRPLFDLDGSHIRYGKVKEIFDNGSSNTYYYTTKEDNPDQGYIAYNLARGGTTTNIDLAEKNIDLAPHTTQFWKRGLLTKKISLDALGNETRLETFEYNTDPTVKGRVKGFFPFTDKMFVYVNSTIPEGVPGVDWPGIPKTQWTLEDIYLAEYEYQSQPIYMTQKRVKGIDIPETYISYSYGENDNAVLLKKETTSSGSVSSSTTYKYPFDYPNQTGTEEGNAIKYMRDNNILSAPIEVVKYKNNKVVGGELYIYDKWNYRSHGSIMGAMFNLKEVKELLMKKPKLSSAFKASQHEPVTGGYKFVYDAGYVTKTAYEYNSSNKVNCIKEQTIPNQSFLYGSNPDLPIAQITNAEVKVINGYPCDESFYTSFEDANGKTHARAKTGSKVLTGGYYTDMSHLVAGAYWVSYWQSFNDGVDWEIYETEVEVRENDNRQYTIGGQGALIDEYRIWKKGSQMQTKTYDASFNVTSSTDENGKTTYYDYDAFGRLINISDNNHDTLKEYKYFIKQ